MKEREEYLVKAVKEGGDVDLSKLPGADFYYKMVAKVDGGYYSIYDANTQYKIGEVNSQPVKPDKKGGYFVYKHLE